RGRILVPLARTRWPLPFRSNPITLRMRCLRSRLTFFELCALVTCALASACKQRSAADPELALQIASESLRLRIGDPAPRTSPFFDGHTIDLVAARGETLAFQVLHRGGGTATLELAGEG